VVKVGQVYADKDPRMDGRHLLVRRVEGLYAYCYPCRPNGLWKDGDRETRISVRNLETRFRLVKDAEEPREKAGLSLEPFIFKWTREARLLRERSADLLRVGQYEGSRRAEAKAGGIEEMVKELVEMTSAGG